MTYITILGAGAWGTALGQILSDQHHVTIWGRDCDKIKTYQKTCQHHGLQEVQLSEKIHWSDNFQDALKQAQIVIMAIPTQHCYAAYLNFKHIIPAHLPLIQTAKGIEITTGFFTPQILQAVFPDNPIFLLSGPGFASDLAKKKPTAVSLAHTSAPEETIKFVHDIFLKTVLRPYQQKDMMGVALGGALKNILAIAAGFCIGHNLGEGAKSAIITRGFNEMLRLSEQFQADPKTIYGLSGLGDLMLTANSMLSRNYQYGFTLGHDEIMNLSQATVEGYHTLIALEKKVTLEPQDYPIFSALWHLIMQKKSKQEIIMNLLDRPFKKEFY